MTTPTFEVATITPAEAAKLLMTINTRNRRIKRGHVSRLTRAIVSGEWKVTSQGIAIGSDGVLLDGQHRLAAIVRAKIPVQIVISRNCDPETFGLIDTGIKRTAGDAVFLSAKDSSEMGSFNNLIAGGIKLYISYKQRPNSIWSGGYEVASNTAIMNVFKTREADSIALIKYLRSCWKTFRPLNMSGALAMSLLALDEAWTMEDIHSFFNLVTTGAGLEETSPILSFRNYVTNNYRLKVRVKGNTGQIALASLMKVFNAHQTGKSISKFRAPKIPPMPMLENKIGLGLAPEIIGIIRA